MRTYSYLQAHARGGADQTQVATSVHAVVDSIYMVEGSVTSLTAILDSRHYSAFSSALVK